MLVVSKTYYLLWSFVTAGAVIYFILCTLIYMQSKQKSFLYYGLYNFFLLTYLLLKTPIYYKELILPLLDSRWASYNWFSQVIYNSMLFLFYRAFLDLKIHHPKFNRILYRFLWIQFTVAFLIFVYTVFTYNHFIFTKYFHFVFIPIISCFVLYALYIAFKIPNKLGYFIIVGVVLYNFFAYYALYKSNHFIEGEKEPINNFYIGIILESLVFILGLGYKVKLIYLEKINAQKKIIIEQHKNQLLKENQQKLLEKTLEERISELKVALQKSEDEKINTLKLNFENEINLLKLESLRSQMNPHFIFNALNSIKVYFIENNKEKAIYYLNKFSKLIRKILESSRNDSITLEEELEIIELYMSIENIRFENSIQFKITVNPSISLHTIKIPSLILQPFIENAIWHGLMLKEGEKTIDIVVRKKDNLIELSIIDNGIGRFRAKENKAKKSFKKDSLGIEFANERLNYFNKKENLNYSFNIEDLTNTENQPIGTKVIFQFPF